MQLHVARAALRALQQCSLLRTAWPQAPFQELLLGADVDVRWCGVECLACMTGLVRPCCARTAVAFLQVSMGPDTAACGPRVCLRAPQIRLPTLHTL